MTTAYLLDDRWLLHDDFDHPENADRLRAIRAGLATSDLLSRLQRLEPRHATVEELLAVHHGAMLERTQRMATFGGGRLNLDTYVVQESWDSALLAAGAVIRAAEAVLGGEASNAFALVRPPGHHATPSSAMGFCLVNNVAVAARVARERLGVRRVAIIDWDTHHGNGTQDIFYDDPDVLYVSSHTYPFYPGTGHWREQGASAGEGTILNVPLPFYCGDEHVLRAYDELVLPAVRRFAPELIIVSAGYDTHWRDPLAPMLMTVSGFERLARVVASLADEVCDGRLVCALEGGYDLEALWGGVHATLRVLLGETDPIADPLGAPPPGVKGDAASVDLDPLITYLKRVHPLLA